MELLDNGCLKILLTEDDLRAFHLTFEDMDYSNDNTRNILHQLLETAHEETGFDPNGSLVIEALPVDGGCLLLLTPVSSKRRVRMKRAIGPFVYELEDADTVLRFARSVYGHTPPMCGSSLYQFDNRYRLVLYPGQALSKEMTHMLNEFAHLAGEGDAAAAFTAEHGASISVGDALGQLCAAMCSDTEASAS